ncbi:MAG: hypothetical protein IJD83_02365 [Clostridia bacterium]|nr:hypothetical protein [Clostridia bacterium]
MKKTFYECSNKERKSKISNRMLISFGYAMLGLCLAYMMMRVARGEYGATALLNYKVTMLVAFIISAIASIALYVLSKLDKIKPECKFAKLKYKERFRNYAHLFLALALACFYVNFAYYTKWLPIESAPAVLSFLKNIVKSYYVVITALSVYAVFTIGYHLYLYYIKKW